MSRAAAPSASVTGPGPTTAWEEHVGERIVVRTRTSTGFVDVLGDLLEVTQATLLIRTRRGERTVERDTITAGHPVPPAPARAAPPHRALAVGDLELVMAEHWVAPEQDWLGGWLLRAAGGFTNRANSVLAVGEPGMPMEAALTEVADRFGDWRYLHLKAVHRTMGAKVGSGGSAGSAYLRRSMERTVFPELWTSRTEM